MKKLIALVIMIAPAVVVAQSANVNVSATIDATLTLTKYQDFTFGLIPSDASDATVTATSGSTTNTGVNAQRGIVDVTAGIDGANIEFVLPDSTALSDINAIENDIMVYFTYAYSNSDGANGTTISSGDVVALNEDAIEADIFGRLFIGGTIRSTNAWANTGMSGKSGQFQGSITIQANFF